MIKANELRPLNYIFYQDEIIQIDAIKKSIASVQEKHDYEIEMWVPLINCKPIPIMPDILEKAGFVDYPEGYDDKEMVQYQTMYLGKNKTSQIAYIDNKFYVSGQYDPDFYGVQAEVKYLHQLQNLYYALTGEELKISLTSS